MACVAIARDYIVACLRPDPLPQKKWVGLTCCMHVWAMARDLSSKTSVRRLNDGNEIPILGLGVWRSEPGGEAEQAVSWALKHGYRLIDTAAIYKNEEDVGRAIRKSGIPREEIFLTTKLWDTDHGKAETLKAFEESLTKLGLDYIDLYLIHSPFGGKIVESWDAMIEIKEKGLAKSIGVSSFNVHHLQQLKLARPDHIPAVNQIELHPYLARDECVAYCQQEGIVMEAYSPLTKGKKLKDPLLVQIAEKYKKSTAQLLIRWSLQHGNICIPKSAKEHRIIENADVFDFNISDEDMQVLNGLDEQLITDWDPMPSPWES